MTQRNLKNSFTDVRIKQVYFNAGTFSDGRLRVTKAPFNIAQINGEIHLVPMDWGCLSDDIIDTIIDATLVVSDDEELKMFPQFLGYIDPEPVIIEEATMGDYKEENWRSAFMFSR